jgi:hypothetical protein
MEDWDNVVGIVLDIVFKNIHLSNFQNPGREKVVFVSREHV